MKPAFFTRTQKSYCFSVSNFSILLCFARPSVNQITEDRQQRSWPVDPNTSCTSNLHTKGKESNTGTQSKWKLEAKWGFSAPRPLLKAYKAGSRCLNLFKKSHKILTATDLTALISFLLSKFFSILLISVKGRLLLYLMSLLQIPVKNREVNRNK